MIVCLCHHVSDRDIERAVDDGIRCFDVLQDELLVAASCACCHDAAREIFDGACTRPCARTHGVAEPVVEQAMTLLGS